MQFKNIVAAAAVIAATASALPTVQDLESVAPAPEIENFVLVALQFGSPPRNQGLSASQAGLWIGHKQDANCFGKTSDFAIFQLNTTSQELFLFNTTELSTQQFYTDRSGMGQGVLQYTNGLPSNLGRNSETKGFAFNANNELQFDGNNFVACPIEKDSSEYTIWVDVGIDRPGNNPNACIKFTATRSKTPELIDCYYTTN